MLVAEGAGTLARLRASWRPLVAGACLVAGVICLTFPVWSGWWTQHVQAVDAARFRQLAAAPVAPAAVSAAQSAPTPPVSVAASAPTGVGTVLAELQIPAIGVDQFVLRGLTYAPAVWERLLRDGPSHLAGSALPGQAGNMVIFGHLNIWGSVFYHLAEVRPGDVVHLVEPAGTYTYTVTSQESVAATDLAAVAPHHSGPATIQLVTCESAFGNDRLVVVGRLTSSTP